MRAKKCLMILIIFMLPVVFLFSGCSKQKDIEFRVQDNYIQWHYVGEENWVDLLPISELGTGDISDENPQQLAFYPLDDGTYGVGIGNATQLSHITIPDTYMGKKVTKIVDGGFDIQSSLGNKFQLTSITIGKNIKTIGKYAFGAAHQIKNLYIPDNVIEIGHGAFYGEFENIHIGSGLAKDYGSFSLSSNGKLTIKSSDRNIYDDAFFYSGLETLITEVEFVEGVEVIVTQFQYWDNLKKVVIPSSVTTIYDFNNLGRQKPDIIYSATLKDWCEVKKDCNNSHLETDAHLYIDGKEVTNLTKENMQGITQIEAGSFICINFNSIFLPKTVTHVGKRTFYSSGYIFCEATEKPSGWAEDWVSSNNNVYWYSESEPTSSGNFWHYDADEETPVIWQN